MPETMELRVNVCPQRLAILLPSDASTAQLRLSIRLLSQIWGGEYSYMFSVGTDALNQQTSELLKRFRPDVVVGVGVDHDYWEAQVKIDCQPLNYVKVNDGNIKEALKIGPYFISAFDAINGLTDDYPTMTPDRSRGTLWQIPEGAELGLIVDFATGDLPTNDAVALADRIGSEFVPIDSDIGYPRFVEMCQSLEGRWTWLDLASYGVAGTSFSGMGSPPTVVVVDNPALDLPLYWNLRHGAGRGAPSRLLPLPIEHIDNLKTIESVTKWVAAWRDRSEKPNYARIASRSLGPPEAAMSRQAPLHRLARRLRARLQKHGIKYVDVVAWDRILPLVFPKHEAEVVTARQEGRAITFQPPRPRFARHIRNDSAWIIELLKDEMTGKLPFRFSCPPSRAAVSTLRAAIPPWISSSTNVGLGYQAVNIRCTNDSDRVVFEYPEDSETLEAHLTTCGIKPRLDEKRRVYEAAVDLIGGLYMTAQCLSGQVGSVMEAFIDWKGVGRSESKAVPRSVDDLKRLAKTGKGSIGKQTDLKKFSEKYLEPEADALTSKRFEKYFQEDLAQAGSLEELLDKWRDQHLILPGWQMACKQCGHATWMQKLDLTSGAHCEACKSPIVLKTSVDIGYKLNPLLARALIEGMAPVILTARLLQGLSLDGFSIMPGVKAVYQKKDIDIDLVASCDGELVVAECKTLRGGFRGATATQVGEQLRSTVALGLAAGARAVFLASFTDTYPQSLKRLAKELSTDEVKVTLLNRSDLNSGYAKGQKSERIYHLFEYLPDPPKRSKKRRSKGPRQIKWG